MKLKFLFCPRKLSNTYSPSSHPKHVYMLHPPLTVMTMWTLLTVKPWNMILNCLLSYFLIFYVHINSTYFSQLHNSLKIFKLIRYFINYTCLLTSGQSRLADREACCTSTLLGFLSFLVLVIPFPPTRPLIHIYPVFHFHYLVLEKNESW